MPTFSSLFGTQTLKQLDGLAQGEYDDPFKLLGFLERPEKPLTSFASELWNTALLRYPCELFARLCEESAAYFGASEFTEATYIGLPETRREEFLFYLQTHPIKEAKDIPAAVSDYLFARCLSSPPCRPCQCKRMLVEFFQTMSDDGKNFDAAKRIVNYWLSGHRPTDRKTYIELCYALGLRTGSKLPPSLSANRFLSFACDQNPLYVRNVEEAVHYFCLHRPLGQDLPIDEPYDAAENYRYAESLLTQIKNVTRQGVSKNQYTAQSLLYIDEIKEESDLFSFLSGLPSVENQRYQTATRLLTQFLEEYDDDLHIDEWDTLDDDLNESESRMKKKEAHPLVRAFMNMDVMELKRLIPSTSFCLSDALYQSGIVRDMVKGKIPVDRSVVLLTALALNYGILYDVDKQKIRQGEDLNELLSFNAFCCELSDVLDSCAMAPLYPRRKLDFLILYSYLKMTKQIHKRSTTDSLTYYLTETIRDISVEKLQEVTMHDGL